MRQFYEAYVDAGEKVSAMLRQTPHATSAFKGTYVLEFLGLSTGRSEADLHSGLLRRLREFPVELGRDFCFVGSEFPRAVGGRDFALDLLFFRICKLFVCLARRDAPPPPRPSGTA